MATRHVEGTGYAVPGTDRRDRRTIARAFATVLVVAFLAAGLMGFIRPLTDAAGSGLFITTDAHLLGIFHVNWLHNLVHLGTGLLALGAAARTPSARVFAQGLGVIYTLVFLAGLLTNNLLGILPLNGADNILHLVSGAVALAIGLASPARGATRARA